MQVGAAQFSTTVVEREGAKELIKDKQSKGQCIHAPARQK